MTSIFSDGVPKNFMMSRLEVSETVSTRVARRAASAIEAFA